MATYDMTRTHPELGRAPRREVTRPTSTVLAGAAWMVGISLLLFFLPLINGLVGGLVGGYKVGGVGRALAAAILPAVLVGAGVWALLMLVGVPMLGLFSGIAVGVLVLLADVGLFVGAAIGGWLATQDR